MLYTKNSYSFALWHQTRLQFPCDLELILTLKEMNEHMDQ